MKKIFRNPICQWLFGIIPPQIGIGLADYFSTKSRQAAGNHQLETFLGEENEWLLIYSKEMLQKEHFDYFLFGHRHIVLDIPIGERSTFINLGDWMIHFTYAEFDGNTCKIKYFEK